jgi:hypothetical protein
MISHTWGRGGLNICGRIFKKVSNMAIFTGKIDEKGQIFLNKFECHYLSLSSIYRIG